MALGSSQKPDDTSLLQDQYWQLMKITEYSAISVLSIYQPESKELFPSTDQ